MPGERRGQRITLGTDIIRELWAREAAVQLGANQGRLWASRSSSKIDLLWKGVPIDLPRAIYLGIFEGPKVDVGAVRRYHSDRHDQLRQDLGAFSTPTTSANASRH